MYWRRSPDSTVIQKSFVVLVMFIQNVEDFYVLGMFIQNTEDFYVCSNLGPMLRAPAKLCHALYLCLHVPIHACIHAMGSHYVCNLGLVVFRGISIC